MADLQINYDRLHELANDARSLKEHLDDTVPGFSSNDLSGVSADNEQVGSDKLANSLSRLRSAWERPFKDSMDRLSDLATLLDSVATKFFDMDADFAQQAASVLSRQQMSDWETKNKAYQDYQANNDATFQPSPLWNENGQLENQPAVHLYNYGTGSGQTPIPENPGEQPHETSYQIGPDGRSGDTQTTYDDSGRVTSETTVVKSSSGFSYTETTDYSYQGDSRNPSSAKTTLTHSDGTVETIDTTYDDPGPKDADGRYDQTITLDSATTDPSDADNNSSSTTTVTQHYQATSNPEKPTDLGYSAVSVDQDGKTTKVEVTNNDGSTNDVKVVTDDDGTVREYKGNYDSDTWEQTSGPREK